MRAWIYRLIHTILESDYRRKGVAFEALQLMLEYITGHRRGTFVAQESEEALGQYIRSTYPSQTLPGNLLVPLHCLITRISMENTSSIKLFEKLGFVVVKRVEVFREVEMRFRGTPSLP